MKEKQNKNGRVGVLDVRMQITNKIYGRVQVRNEKIVISYTSSVDKGILRIKLSCNLRVA